MNREEIFYLLPYLFSLALSVGVFVYTWQHRYVRGARVYSWFVGGQSLTIAGFIFELISPNLQTKILWDKFQWLTDSFLVFIPFLFFAIQFSEYKLRHPRLAWGYWIGVPVLFTLFLFTDNLHHQLYPNPHLSTDYPFPDLQYNFTIGVYLYSFIYIYGANFYGIGLLIKRAIQPYNVFRLQYWTIAIGFLIPLVLSFFTLANIKIAPQRDISPFTFAIENLIVAWGLFRYGLFDIIPIAREQIVENMKDPVVVLDAVNRVVDINQAALIALGQLGNQVIGHSGKDVFARWPVIASELEFLDVKQKEIAVQNDDDTFFYDLNISSIQNDRGQLIGRVIVARDVTRHKTLEAGYRILSEELEQRVKERTNDLRKAAERYRAVVENQTEFIVRWKLDGTRTFVNEAYCRYFGIAYDQALTTGFMPLIAEEDRQTVAEKYSRLKSGTINSETDVHRVIKTDGTLGWQEWTDQAIRDESGQILEFQSVGRDITERMQAEEALRESEAIYRKAIEVAGGVPYRQTYQYYEGYHLHMAFDFLGEGIRQLTGYGPDEMTEELWDSLIQESNLIGELSKYSWSDAIQRVRNGSIPVWQCEHRLQTRTGETRWVYEASVELRNKDGRSHGSIGLYQDITERKRAEETILRQLAFDELMTRLLTDFATRPTSEMDASIRNALQETAIFFRGEFSDVLLLSEDKTFWNTTHSWVSPHLLPSIHPTENIQTRTLLWSENKLLNGEPIKINSLEDYPLEAAIDRQFGEAEGIKSLLSVPIRGRGQFVVGIIDVVSYTSHTTWSDSDVNHLKLIGDAIANLLERKKAGEALQKSEERFSKAFHASPTIITITQLNNGKLLEVNEAFEEIMGYTRSEVLGKTTVELGLWKAQADRENIVNLLSVNGQLKNEELQFRTKHGNFITCNYSAELIDLEGEKCLISTLEDITERKKAEARIVHLNRLYVTISQINQAVVHTEDKNTLFNEICRVVIEYGKFRMVWIGLIDENKAAVHPIIFAGAELGYLENITINLHDTTLSGGPTGAAILEERCIICQDIATDPRMEHWRDQALSRGYRSSAAVPLREQGLVMGALTVYSDEPQGFNTEDEALLEQIGQDVSFALDSINARLKRELAEANLADAYDTTLEGWAKALELRDKETEGHSRRVTETTLAVARAMGISEEELVHIRRGSILHDIGKMGIPDDILRKNGPLTDEERAIVNRHPTTAYNLLKPIAYLEMALDIPYRHHEKWDGSGYPDGLAGSEIPLAARIFAVVDVWDALSSDRPYRKAWDREDVIQYVMDDSGKHFDPRVVDSFLVLVGKGEI